MKCAVCDQELRVRWTDTHGIGACVTCGLPYRIYHYEGDTRVEKPPSIAVMEAWLPLAKQYWDQTHSRVFPAEFDFMGGRGGLSYSGASHGEIVAFEAWMVARKSEWPQAVGEAQPAEVTP